MAALITETIAPQPITNATLPAGYITPEFDVASLTVDELREEMRRRGQSSQGSKNSLVQRLQEMIESALTPAQRLVSFLPTV